MFLSAIIAVIVLAILSFLLLPQKLPSPASTPLSQTTLDPQSILLVPETPTPTPIPILRTPTGGTGLFLASDKGQHPADIDTVWIEEMLAEMTMAEKIGQMLLIGLHGSSVTPTICGMIQDLTPGGIHYLSARTTNSQQLKDYSEKLQACAQSGQHVPLFLSVETEGEYSKRFHKGLTVFPEAVALGAANDPFLGYQVAQASGHELAFSGLNMVLGPIADVLLDPISLASFPNTYGGDSRIVSQYVEQAVGGYRTSGMVPVLKHFPGISSHAEGNPDPRSDLSIPDENMLLPFQRGAAAGAPAILIDASTAKNQGSSQSTTDYTAWLIEFLRQEMEFNGMILVDARSMRSTPGQKFGSVAMAAEFVGSGGDMILITDPSLAAVIYQGLQSAVQSGQISAEYIDQAVRRILMVKAAFGVASFSLPAIPEPDWQAHAALASEAASRSVTLIHDTQELIPLPKGHPSVLVIGPDRYWDFYPKLQTALLEAGTSPRFQYYFPPWFGQSPETQYLETLPKMAKAFDITIIFTWHAHINNRFFNDPWQVQLVKNVRRTGTQVIVIALESPSDLLEFSHVGTYLATYGTNEWAMKALIDILVGEKEAVGQNPLPGLE